MERPKYSLQLEFRGFAKGVMARFNNLLEREMTGVSDAIVEKFDGASNKGNHCDAKNGIGSLRFTGEIDASRVVGVLNEHFQNTRLIEPSIKALGIRKMPEIIKAGNDEIRNNVGFDLRQEDPVPKVMIIEAPENS